MKNLESLFEAQKDTILGAVNEVYLRGDFTPPTILLSLNEDEVIVGEATDYEKAAVIAGCERIDIYNQKLRKSKEEGKPVDLQDVLIDKAIFQGLNNLFWVLVQKRLGLISLEPDILELRENWKIIAREVNEDEIPELDIEFFLR